MKIKKKSGIDGQLDDAWSKLVKLRAGNKCEYCGKQTTLNSHHIFTRSRKATRWNVDNGVCLCASHHSLSSSFSAHSTPLEFTEWLYEKKGKEFITRLRIRSNNISKMFKFEKELLLKELNKEIKNHERKH